MIEKLIISHVIAALIGAGLGYACLYFIENIWTKRFRNFSSERSTALHEVGHMVAWFKYCPWWNNKYAFEQHVERIEHIAINNNQKCGHLRFYEKKVDPDDRTKYHNKNLLIGGMITEMLFRNLHLNRWTMFVYEHIYGCHDDLRRLRNMGMTNKQIIELGRRQMADIDDYDREFIEDISNNLQYGRCKDDEGWKVISAKELKIIAKVYHAGEHFHLNLLK